MKLKDIKRVKRVWNPNQYKMPCTQLDPTEENAKFMNDLVKIFKKRHYNKIERTKIGSYSYSRTIVPAYDFRATKSIFELTVVDEYMYRIQFRTVNTATADDGTDTTLFGRDAFKLFKKMCLDNNIDLDDYAETDGRKHKEEIEKYMIDLTMFGMPGKTYKHCHHIDFHSSFPSGLVNTHPEFRPVIETLYAGRKSKPEYKYILNATIGYMQSIPCCSAKWAALSRDAINDNNKRVRELYNRLLDNGFVPLAFNTDGIWYYGDGPKDIYHGQGEGLNICEWGHDHIDCTLRFKSKGSYEFIEDGKYQAVVRGRTYYDRIVPRENWVWGDIFREDAEVLKFTLVDDQIVIVEEHDGKE